MTFRRCAPSNTRPATPHDRTCFSCVYRWPAQCLSALLANPKVRTVHVPSATRDVRNAYARLRCSALAEQCNSTPDAVARVVAACTEEWNLDLLESLLQASLQNGLSNLIEIEEVSRAIRVGTAKSPWVGQQIREVVGQAEANLEARVKGQPQALEAVVAALKKDVRRFG